MRLIRNLKKVLLTVLKDENDSMKEIPRFKQLRFFCTSNPLKKTLKISNKLY